MSLDLIQQTIHRLQSLVCLPTQNRWQFYRDRVVENKQFQPSFTEFNPQKLMAIAPNDKGYLVFEKGLQLAWFHQKIILPSEIRGYVITNLNTRLNLTWWAEVAAIFVNGQLCCAGDLFDSSTRLLLTDYAQPGQEFEVAIALVSPAHDVGALMKSALIFESPTLAQLEAGSFATELQILANYLQQYAPHHLEQVTSQLRLIPWEQVNQTAQFNQALEDLRQALIPLAKPIKAREFYILGHAHLDMAWLWTTTETWIVGQRTFQSVLNLQQEFPELTFGHSTPALYAWIEQHRPDLWQQIQQAVTENKWELLGGMWVEPDVNLVSGESIIRQFLYGQQYFLEKFGQVSRIAWLPDSFGFPQQLPQICLHCEITAFGTGKLHWNDTNPFPHGLFRWRSPDGSELLTLMTPPNVTGIMDTNPITMTNYALKWEAQTGLTDIFWLPGVGDHGGGPTKDMVQVKRKWQQSPFMPNLEFSTVQTYLDKVKNTPNLPIWNDELYLELHRGCYTVHRDQKVFNQSCETLLRQAELWTAIAQNLPQAHINIPEVQPQLTQLWHKVLFNQFHDILPGTSIPEVFTEANQAWQAVIQQGEAILSNSLQAIASQINYGNPPHPNAQPLLLFNDLNWERTETVTIPIQELMTVYHHQGEAIAHQIITEACRGNATTQTSLSFLAQVPPLGYALYWLVPNPHATIQHAAELADEPEFILENEFLRVQIDPTTGDIAQLIDQQHQQTIFAGAGNQLQAFKDQGQYWDAWDIAPDYENHPLSTPQLISIQWHEKNQVRSIIRVTKQLNQSTFIQDYQLDSTGKILKIYTTADWQEEQVVLKTAFPFTLNNATCTYEAPCAAIARPPKQDPAKWEVPALRWADFHNQTYGISILTKNHHSYDAKAHQLRLTLLKSPLWPDPMADRGIHHLAYAIYPHAGTWQAAATPHYARAFNTPLRALNPHHWRSPGSLTASHSFMSLGAKNLILLALKQAEDQRGYVLRFYEAQGENAVFKFDNSLGLEIDAVINGLEQSLTTTIDHDIQPWKIQSYRLTKQSSTHVL